MDGFARRIDILLQISCDRCFLVEQIVVTVSGENEVIVQGASGNIYERLQIEGPQRPSMVKSRHCSVHYKLVPGAQLKCDSTASKFICVCRRITIFQFGFS